MTTRLHDLHLDTSNLTLEQLETFGSGLSGWQRGINFWIGDVALYAKRVLKLGDNYTQVFPETMSPGLIQRCEAVAAAYPPADRNPDATWSIHRNHANDPNRVALVQAAVDAGSTSDEDRKNHKSNRWLLAIDVHYFVHRTWFSGGGVETAVGVSAWIQRTVDRLKTKGLSDVACCFDSKASFRKELTAEWDDKYKDRPPKDPELASQLELTRELLEGHGLCCVSADGMEADDLLASYAAQFDGRVTILTQDKDVRQCLTDDCNILLDVEWQDDTLTGKPVPEYKWLTAKSHVEATGVEPRFWTAYQSLMGDAVDNIKGAAGIGAKGAADLVSEFGSLDSVLAAARNGDERISERRRVALMSFERFRDVTEQLVTLRTDLELPKDTKI